MEMSVEEVVWRVAEEKAYEKAVAEAIERG
jgi:hypothetical protein